MAFDEASRGVTRSASGVRIQVLAQPRASRDAFVALHDGQVKIALRSAPVDGEANAALIAFLAKALRVPRKSVSLVQGEASRRKTVLVEGDADDLMARIEALLPSG